MDDVKMLLLLFSEWLDTSGYAIQVDADGATHEEIANQFLDEFASTPAVRNVLTRA